jgi:thioredoxin-related protein
MLWLGAAIAFAAAAPQEIEVPAWFKHSFLDLREDIREAAAVNKRVMIYFGQNGCPYCKKLMDVNFSDKAIADKTRRGFDAIEINIYGSREVTWLDGKPRSEKDFAALLKVQFTPTILFLDEKGSVVLRVNGYFPPREFHAALDYAALRGDRKPAFGEFQKNYALAPDSGVFHEQRFFKKPPYDFDRRKPAARPLAIFFEQRNCAGCDEMHGSALSADATRRQLSRFDVYRLDVHGTDHVVSPAGASATAAQWARELNVAYTPTVVFFDGRGREVFRIEAYVRTFHLQAALDYVASGAYRKEPSFQRYVQAHAESIRERGGRVDIMK